MNQVSQEWRLGAQVFCFFLLFTTNPSTPHMMKQWQSSHIKLKALNFLTLSPVLFPLEYIESPPLPAHGWPLTPPGAKIGAHPADGADIWSGHPTETRKQQVEAKPATEGWNSAHLLERRGWGQSRAGLWVIRLPTEQTCLLWTFWLVRRGPQGEVCRPPASQSLVKNSGCWATTPNLKARENHGW